MSEEEQPQEVEDGERGEFKQMLEDALGKHLTPDKFDAAMERYVAKISDQLDNEEDENATRKTKDSEPRSDGGGSDPERSPSDAERARDAGRVGNRAKSGYWEKIGKKILYG